MSLFAVALICALTSLQIDEAMKFKFFTIFLEVIRCIVSSGKSILASKGATISTNFAIRCFM